MTNEQRQLRQNIRNFCCGASSREIQLEISYRVKLGRSDFEISCFQEILEEIEFDEFLAGK